MYIEIYSSHDKEKAIKIDNPYLVLFSELYLENVVISERFFGKTPTLTYKIILKSYFKNEIGFNIDIYVSIKELINLINMVLLTNTQYGDKS